MYTAILMIFIPSCSVVSSVTEFRVLAPQFVCPAGGDTDKHTDTSPNQSYITIKATGDLQVTWVVRWKPVPAPTQRFTITLWKTVRELEKKLNGPQKEHFVYVIKDSELMGGVTYIFNVTGSSHEGNTTKSFSIDYSAGDQKLLDIVGRSDKFSLQLLGGQETYADLGVIIEAQVTTCSHTQDYYFRWTISNTKSYVIKDTERGQRLDVPAFFLEPGHYTVKCEAIKQSNGNPLTESILPIKVLYRDIKVYINVDRLVISIGKEFTLSSYVSPDYEEQYQIEWKCFFNNEERIYFDNANFTTLNFFQGIPNVGEYLITVTVSESQQSAAANATVIVVESNLPVIEVAPIPRIVNVGSDVYIAANVSNLTPFCTLAWFIYDDSKLSNRTSEELSSGVIVSEIATIFSLEQSFLNEIDDYTNDTEQRETWVTVDAFDGRARIVANCSGSDDDVSYADVYFEVNKGPEIANVMVTPKSGIALETSFRISTTVAVDEHTPIFYSFYCKLGGNDTLLLGSYMEHYAVETYLPHINNDMEVFVVACDSLGACTPSGTDTVHVGPSSGDTMASIAEDLTAHVRRCEILQLERLAISAILSFSNADQMDKVSILTEKLIAILPSIHLRCVSSKHYEEILTKLTYAGIDINTLFGLK